MLDVVVVRLKATKCIYFLSPNCLDLKKGMLVVIETENGVHNCGIDTVLDNLEKDIRSLCR